MPFCRECGFQINGNVTSCPNCGHPIQPPYGGFQPQQPMQQPYKPDSHMVMAILSTLFCCLPTGIYAIIQASKVDGHFYAGRYGEAQAASNDAQKWSIIGMVLAIVGWVIYILIYVFIIGAALAAS